jgi:hypothetical protein
MSRGPPKNKGPPVMAAPYFHKTLRGGLCRALPHTESNPSQPGKRKGRRHQAVPRKAHERRRQVPRKAHERRHQVCMT